MLKWLKNFFIPHEGNSFAPHGLQKRAMVAMLFLVFLSFLGTNVQSLVWTNSKWLISTVLPGVIVELTNDERADNSLPALKRSAVLDEAARMKAEDMAANQYFAHFSPTGISPWHWFAEADYSFVHAGENLAIHFTDSSEVVDAWMNSPTHRANIVNKNYREIGVGTAEGTYQGYKTVYVVQLFGTPAAAAPAVAAAVAPEPVVAAAPEPEPIRAPEPQPEPEKNEETVAAESAAITEEIEFFEAESAPVTSSEAVPATELADVEATENGIALYSDHISTSTNAVPASIEPQNADVAGNTVPYAYELATRPHLVLEIFYTLLALFVVSTLTLSIVIEMRRQQPLQVAYGVAMLLLMAGLWSLHIVTTAGALVV